MPDRNFMGDLEILHYHMPELQVGDHLDPITLQTELQRVIAQHRPEGLVQTGRVETYGELLKRVRFNREAMDDEWAEIMSMLPWKEWKTYVSRGPGDPISEEDRRELAFEVVDMFHFLLNLCIALGVDWQLLLDIYLTKNRENHRRQQEGYSNASA